MKKLLAIATMFVLGCGSAPSQEKQTATSTGPGGINLPDNGEPYVGPCDKPTFTTIVVDGRKVVVEVPTLCNESFGPDHGDPGPDRGDPNPVERLHPEVLSEKILVEQQQGNAR